jgi:NAD(P)-dependent dehydrogenase (short-subunit alcohol dehydrogenase family)
MSRSKITENSRAVVTGAGSGIGRAFALELQQRGGRVVCADINLESAARTVQEIKQRGGEALAVSCDVADLSQMQGLAEQAHNWFGEAPNLLINNAGVGAGGQCIEDISMEDWQWIMGINLWGVIHGCHVFLPLIKNQPQGGIINVASAASFGSSPMMGAYNTTKSAVLALTETLHAENASTGINVSVVCPTFVKTDVIKNARMKNQKPGSVMERTKAQAMMNKFGHSPESVVIKALNGLDKNRMYILPQMDARMTWFLKRLSPGNFVRLSGYMAGKLIQ